MQTEEDTLRNKLTIHFQKALKEFSMIKDGDKVLIGLSGGKDSLCLLELLSRRAAINKPSFHIEALHVRMNNIHYETDGKFLSEFTNEHGVNLHTITTQFDEEGLKDKPACFLCSWYRRKALFEFAQANGFNKIALGHHMDDIIHTAMLNIFYQGSFATMPAVMQMSKMPLTIIRPLCHIKEEDIAAYASIRGYKQQIKQCPYEKCSNRTNMRKVFEQIECDNPEARYSVWHALKKDGKLMRLLMDDKQKK